MSGDDTDADRELVRALLHQMADRHPEGWEGLMQDAGVPWTTGQGWRYKRKTAKRKPSSPRAIHLVHILRAAGVLNEQFLLPEVMLRASDAARAMEEETRQRFPRVRPRRRPSTEEQTG